LPILVTVTELLDLLPLCMPIGNAPLIPTVSRSGKWPFCSMSYSGSTEITMIVLISLTP